MSSRLPAYPTSGGTDATPAPAAIDAVPCEAPERAFLDHPLRSETDTPARLARADTVEPLPLHPRLTDRWPRAGLLAVAAGLTLLSGRQEAVR